MSDQIRNAIAAVLEAQLAVDRALFRLDEIEKALRDGQQA